MQPHTTLTQTWLAPAGSHSLLCWVAAGGGIDSVSRLCHSPGVIVGKEGGGGLCHCGVEWMLLPFF